MALVGATGSGKSTLCELLVRLADPDAGSIESAACALTDRRSRRARQRVALVLQEPFLFADAVTANVLFADGPPESAEPTTEPTTSALSEALACARADRFVAELPKGPDTLLGERGVTLSGGQRQRAGAGPGPGRCARAC